MASHSLPLNSETVHGAWDRSTAPTLSIDDGDTVVFTTLDAGWGVVGRDIGEIVPDIFPDPQQGKGHALSGPISVRGAMPGHVLEVRVRRLVPGPYGWTWAGPRPSMQGYNLGVEREAHIDWTLDLDAGNARDRQGLGLTVPLRPFMGVMGNVPAEFGTHSTTPPRRVGGNIDCRELIEGSVLFLPVAVPGALFSVGDGHGAQGDGEVSGTAIECPMETVELQFGVRNDLHFQYPQAQTPAGYVTMGFGDTLDEAASIALDAMLVHIVTEHSLERPEAMVLASLTVHLRVTQVVNSVVGVHAVLPPDAFSRQ